MTLEALAADLGWRKGGSAAAELSRTLDSLRLATFRARVHNARPLKVRIDTFGLLDRWEPGERHCDGPARPGFLVLGDWSHEQLVRGHVTVVDWTDLRALRSGTARGLLVYLDAERFSRRTWRRTIEPGTPGDPRRRCLGRQPLTRHVAQGNRGGHGSAEPLRHRLHRAW